MAFLALLAYQDYLENVGARVSWAWQDRRDLLVVQEREESLEFPGSLEREGKMGRRESLAWPESGEPLESKDWRAALGTRAEMEILGPKDNLVNQETWGPWACRGFQGQRDRLVILDSKESLVRMAQRVSWDSPDLLDLREPWAPLANR